MNSLLALKTNNVSSFRSRRSLRSPRAAVLALIVLVIWALPTFAEFRIQAGDGSGGRFRYRNTTASSRALRSFQSGMHRLSKRKNAGLWSCTRRWQSSCIMTYSMRWSGVLIRSALSVMVPAFEQLPQRPTILRTRRVGSAPPTGGTADGACVVLGLPRGAIDLRILNRSANGRSCRRSHSRRNTNSSSHATFANGWISGPGRG